jgi:hypothetical protein
MDWTMITVGLSNQDIENIRRVAQQLGEFHPVAILLDHMADMAEAVQERDACIGC